jgi:hypothetical protein
VVRPSSRRCSGVSSQEHQGVRTKRHEVFLRGEVGGAEAEGPGGAAFSDENSRAGNGVRVRAHRQVRTGHLQHVTPDLERGEARGLGGGLREDEGACGATVPNDLHRLEEGRQQAEAEEQGESHGKSVCPSQSR